jgi:hypothetical protein
MDFDTLTVQFVSRVEFADEVLLVAHLVLESLIRFAPEI